MLRQSTPDLNGIVSIYLNKNEHVDQSEVIDRHINNHRNGVSYVHKNGCQFVNDVFRLWGHQFIYDEVTYLKCIKACGFKEVKKVEFGAHGFNQFTYNLERHANFEWMKKAFVMIFEAKK